MQRAPGAHAVGASQKRQVGLAQGDFAEPFVTASGELGDAAQEHVNLVGRLHLCCDARLEEHGT